MTLLKKLPIGSEIPDFWLPDTNGMIIPKEHLLGAPAALIFFLSNQCQYVKHIREVLVKLVHEYQQRGVAAVAINSNDSIQHPDDYPIRMKADAKIYGYTFPYLLDSTQQTARLFKVMHTPDFFVYNKFGKLIYHGQMDDSRPENGIPVTGNDLRHELNAALQGSIVQSTQKPSVGTFIKWKSDNEPFTGNSKKELLS
jgi:peroxiredoxin